jgi:F-type H+-transporting ATPase subunit alpha
MQLIEKNICIYGVIISTGYGVVTLQGFLIAFIGEVFRICYMGFNSNSFGLVVNLYQNDTMNLLIGALLLNPRNRLSEGAKVNGLCRLASIILGDFAIGSILDPVGNFILNSGRIDVQYRWVVESPAPGIIDRQSVFEPLQTGVISIDSMIPIGRGQRELIVGDRQTGKTSIGVDTILNQKYKTVLIGLDIAQFNFWTSCGLYQHQLVQYLIKFSCLLLALNQGYINLQVVSSILELILLVHIVKITKPII